MYAEFFAFRELPFNITPDPRFLYLNDCYQEAIAALTYGIEGRKGFVSLIGEAGTGKTTLLRHVIETVDPRIKTVLLLNPTVTFDEILEHILNELGVPTEGGGKLALLQRLNEFLLEHTSAGGNVVLLVDEAQDLPTHSIEELRLLSNLETAREKILQIVIAGQPELDRILRDPALRQLRQRITLHVRVRPLAPAEVAAYVRTRLQHAGATNLDIFTPSALEHIAALSRGIPRVVNVLCDASLLTAFVGGSRLVTPSIVDAAWRDYGDGDAPPPPAAEAAAAPATAAPAPGATRVLAPSFPAGAVAPPPPAPAVAPPEPSVAAASAPSPTPPVVAAPAPPVPAPDPPVTTAAPSPAPAQPALGPTVPEWAHRFTARPAPPPEPPPQMRAPEPVTWRSRLGVPVAAALVTALAAGAFSVSWRESRERAAEPGAVAPAAPAPAPPLPPPVAFPVAPPPAVPQGPITAAEATELLEEFRSAYEARDVDRLLALFASDASENGRQGREVIAAAYRAVLTQLDEVHYALPSIAVSPGLRAGVRAPFVISYRQPGGSRGEIRGDAEWALERRDGHLQIVSLNYRLQNGS